MLFKDAVKTLKSSLSKKQPKEFSSTWVYKETPSVYRYIYKNIRTENGDIDWDRITMELDRKYQKRWTRYRIKSAKEYQNQDEVDLVLLRYKDKLYTLMASIDLRDVANQERIIIALVRLSQKGNILARQELISWITFITEEWIEKRWQVRKWKGYTDDVEDKIKNCIRLYKYTGTFLGYLFKTLEYSGRGIRPMQVYSLDDPVGDGSRTRIDFIIEESDIYL
jgi:hypothetical protein